MIGTTELILILIILVVIFGATKLPKLGDALGRSIKNFKSAVKDGKEGKNEKVDKSDSDKNKEA
ncbi:twin-arginine translocase TatA/TatE family subunit [Myxococcota bacterium]|nr:twin-arginine translocase TatA/TatE family subunit [Myxococcota bacterium]MBU1380161.1 twin-arginine translocase TatA/TatE family subunit [Myxococcota bacterium]MBU1498681.1 twin-arginine translocase TatA/TatE family subunit [Myxococcota bacterium]